MISLDDRGHAVGVDRPPATRSLFAAGHGVEPGDAARDDLPVAQRLWLGEHRLSVVGHADLGPAEVDGQATSDMTCLAPFTRVSGG